MVEYEYSKKVDSLDKYIKYCEANSFILSGKVNQIRTIYRKDDSTMARITINKTNKTTTYELDFKEDKLSSGELIARKETLSLMFEDMVAIKSILDFLGYREDNTLIRNRYIYEKDGVKFELDEYIEPEKCNVVSLEGNKEKADAIWKKTCIAENLEL